MSKTIDFDAFRAEQVGEPVSITVGGREYELPASLPASLALDIVRMREAGGDASDMKPEDFMKIGSGLFGGDEPFRAFLLEARVTLDELGELIMMILTTYTGEVAPPSPGAQA